MTKKDTETIGGITIKKDKVSLADAAEVLMAGKYNNRPTYGAKSPIGAAAAQKSYDKNWMKKESSDDTLERIIKDRDEADNEFKRESNRPTYSDKGYKKGGKVKSASARADGCAIRGKTRA